EICRGLGVSTKGTKAKLIQRIRAEQSEKIRKVPCEDGDENETIDANIERARAEIKRKAKMAPPKTTAQNIGDLNGQQQANREMSENRKKSRKWNYQDSSENESPETLKRKILAEFKKLENAILGFNDRLNS
ncbi:34243_t:CDS:2, partial [Racocetra persica]